MPEAVDLAAYAALFVAALIAATVLPMQSEGVLVALLLSGHSPIVSVAVASLGNVLGSVINWLLGRGIERFRHRRWFPVSEASLSRAQAWYRKVGKWSLLMSWLPVVGDPLTMVAGIMREPLPGFIVLVAIGKVLRYVVIAWVTLRVAG
ncbi:YqaA family protein [soil metagenome]